MALTINTNIPSLGVDSSIRTNSKKLAETFERLSSGKQINKAADNPAGLAVALELLSNANSSSVAARNISDGVSVANIAEGSLSSAGDITVRLSELATQSANGTLSSEQRSALNTEFQALSSELTRISETTEFNGQQLLNQDSTINIQAGISGGTESQIALKLKGVSSTNLGLAALDISTPEGAKAAIEQTKAAQESIIETRGELGATVNRLGTAFKNLQVSETNLLEAASRIQDADFAKETASLVANRISQETSVAVKLQANFLPQLALRLLG